MSVIQPPRDFDNLKQLSSWIGSDPTLVQGPGGNTSIKNEESIWVKASGTKLRDAESKNIFVSLKRNSGLPDPVTQQLVGSIETNLHLLIDAPVVAHTHSTTSIAVGFREDLQDLVQAFGRTVIIPYLRPGSALAQGVGNFVDTSIHNFAVLRNHGLLVWGDSAEEVKQLILLFEKSFKKVLEYTESDLSDAKSSLRFGQTNRYLTPDHAVFLDSAALTNIQRGLSEADWLDEMFEQLSIVLAASLKSKSLSWLEKEEVMELRNWDSEKKRKDANK